MMMGRPFRAWEFLRTNTWGVAPGCYVSGPLALRPVIANPSPNNAGSTITWGVAPGGATENVQTLGTGRNACVTYGFESVAGPASEAGFIFNS